MNNKISTVFVLFLILFLAGCSSSLRKVNFSEPDPKIIGEVISAYNSMKCFEADFSVKVKVSVMGGSATGHIYFQGKDKLNVEYKGPLSAFSGNLIVSDGLYELTQSNGQVVVDTVENMNFSELTGIPFPSSDINTLFKPFPLRILKNSKTLAFEVSSSSDSLWVWKLKGKDLDRTIIFDPEQGNVIEEYWTDKRNKKVLSKTYDGYVQLRDQTFARKIKITSKGRIPVEYTLTYDQVRVNPRWKKSPFIFKTVN